jgi:hypothetical protein
MTTYTSPFSGDVVQPTDVSYEQYTLTATIELYWPINGVPAGFNLAARIMDISSSSSAYRIVMPPANQASVGQDALFNNTGSADITILDYDGNSIVVVPSGKSVYLYITDNSTEAGVWGVIDFGTTTSATTASALAGYGLLAIANTLNQSHPTTSVTDGMTFGATNRAQAMVWGGGAGNATLNTASVICDNWFILFKNNGTGTFTINTTGIDLLDDQSSKTFQPNESALIICTGLGYITVGYGTSNTFFFTALTKSVTTGNYNLTSSEASSVIQEFVGSQTGNVTVTYPPVVGFYVVSNQVVDNGFSFIITTGVSGGATATIPAGQQATLICDGVNFLNANTISAGASSTSLTDGSAAIPSLNFASETSTGMYRPAAGTIGLSVLGTLRLSLTATGATVAGTVTANSYVGVAGGTF